MIYLILYLKYKNICDKLEIIGYFMRNKLHFKYYIKSSKILDYLSIISLFEENIYNCYLNKKITFLYFSCITLFYFGFFINIFYVIFVSIFIFMIPTLKLKEKKEYYDHHIKKELPEIIMSVKLLISAGMNTFGTLEYVSKNEGVLYQKIEALINEIKKGSSSYKVYTSVISKSRIYPLTQFFRIIISDEKNGTDKTIHLLHDLHMEMIKDKKVYYLKKGEEASTKLLFPMMISLISIIILIIIPAITQLFTLL